MSEFKLENAPAELKGKSTLLSSTTQSRKNKPTKVTEVKLVFEVDLSADVKGIDFLFPGVDLHCKAVAGLEHYKGKNRTARASLPEMNIKLVYDGVEVLNQKNCPVKTKPQLKINKDGEATLVIRPMVKLDGEELAQIASYIDSDLRISMESAQVDLEHSGENVVMLRSNKVVKA